MEAEVPKGPGKTKKGGKRSRTSGGRTSTTAAMVERKEVERERRQHMKQLCAKLACLIPKENYSSTVRINDVPLFAFRSCNLLNNVLARVSYVSY
jgi:hypothetical protein